MDRIWAGLALITIALIGRYRLSKLIRRLDEHGKFAVEFQKKLHQYFDSRGQDVETYTWLLHRSGKMQEYMGDSGIIATLSLPFGRGTIRNYPVILNSIPEIHRNIHDSLFRGSANEYARMVDESIVRYLGTLQDYHEETVAKLRNPVRCFREGIRSIVMFPAILLEWIGFGEFPHLYSLLTSKPMTFLSAIITGIGLIGSIVTLITGWSQAWAMTQRLIPWLHP
jgi:hypothetical protein